LFIFLPDAVRLFTFLFPTVTFRAAKKGQAAYGQGLHAFNSQMSFRLDFLLNRSMYKVEDVTSPRLQQ
jgi:hypothetical protein